MAAILSRPQCVENSLYRQSVYNHDVFRAVVQIMICFKFSLQTKLILVQHTNINNTRHYTRLYIYMKSGWVSPYVTYN